MNTNTRIYVAFSSSGLFGSAQILGEIRQRRKGVQFIGSTEAEKPEYTVTKWRTYWLTAHS